MVKGINFLVATEVRPGLGPEPVVVDRIWIDYKTNSRGTFKPVK